MKFKAKMTAMMVPLLFTSTMGCSPQVISVSSRIQSNYITRQQPLGRDNDPFSRPGSLYDRISNDESFIGKKLSQAQLDTLHWLDISLDEIIKEKGGVYHNEKRSDGFYWSISWKSNRQIESKHDLEIVRGRFDKVCASQDYIPSRFQNLE